MPTSHSTDTESWHQRLFAPTLLRPFCGRWTLSGKSALSKRFFFQMESCLPTYHLTDTKLKRRPIAKAHRLPALLQLGSRLPASHPLTKQDFQRCPSPRSFCHRRLLALFFPGGVLLAACPADDAPQQLGGCLGDALYAVKDIAQVLVGVRHAT